MSLFSLALGSMMGAASAATKAANKMAGSSSRSSSGSSSSANRSSSSSRSSSGSSSLGWLGNTVANTAVNAYKNLLGSGSLSGGSSSRSSSGSSGTLSGGSAGGGKSIADYQSIWQEANAAGDQARMDWAHQMAEAERAKQGYSGGADGSQYIPLGYRDSEGNKRNSADNTDYYAGYKTDVQNGDWDAAADAADNRLLKLTESGGIDRAQEYMYWMLDAQRAQQDAENYAASIQQMLDQYAGNAQAVRDEMAAQVAQNVANLEAQKPLVQQAGTTANRAAQQNYAQTVDPNGAGAEARAALGLSNSGLTESAQIAASNAYQQAVNQNAQNVSNQLAQIDLAIRNAELSGDIATAQQLQSYYNTVLNAGMQAAGNILSANQWALANRQSGLQSAIGNTFTQAGLSGQLNGQPTMAGQQSSVTLQGQQLQNQGQELANQAQQLQNQLTQENLRILLALGYRQAEAEVLAAEYAAKGQSLANTYQSYQNQLAARQL